MGERTLRKLCARAHTHSLMGKLLTSDERVINLEPNNFYPGNLIDLLDLELLAACVAYFKIAQDFCLCFLAQL